MTLVTWEPDLEIGFKGIDEQHRFLFEATNQLYAAMQRSQGVAEVERTLKVLFDYTVTHLGEEEALMERHEYPRLAKHRKLHLEWVEKCNQLKEKQEEGSFLVSIELLRFLTLWMTNHIKVDDKAFGEYLKTRYSTH